MPAWKECVSHPEYEVSNTGVIRRASNKRVIVGGVTHDGYHKIGLSSHNKRTFTRAHVLVAAAFLGPCPAGHEIDHRDDNKLNNRAGNLEYVTHRVNLRRAAHRYSRPGTRHPRARLTDADIRQIRARRDAGEQLQEIADDFGITDTHVADIHHRKAWAHVK